MIKKFGVYFFLVLAAFLSLFPFYFMFVSGTNTNQDILSAPPRLLPGAMLLSNFSVLIEKMDIIRVAFNTLFISTVFTVLTVLLYSTAGYVLAKFEFKGKGLIFGFIMVSMFRQYDQYLRGRYPALFGQRLRRFPDAAEHG